VAPPPVSGRGHRHRRREAPLGPFKRPAATYPHPRPRVPSSPRRSAKGRRVPDRPPRGSRARWPASRAITEARGAGGPDRRPHRKRLGPVREAGMSRTQGAGSGREAERRGGRIIRSGKSRGGTRGARPHHLSPRRTLASRRSPKTPRPKGAGPKTAALRDRRARRRAAPPRRSDPRSVRDGGEGRSALARVPLPLRSARAILARLQAQRPLRPPPSRRPCTEPPCPRLPRPVRHSAPSGGGGS